MEYHSYLGKEKSKLTLNCINRTHTFTVFLDFVIHSLSCSKNILQQNMKHESSIITPKDKLYALYITRKLKLFKTVQKLNRFRFFKYKIRSNFVVLKKSFCLSSFNYTIISHFRYDSNKSYCIFYQNLQTF